MKRRGLSVLGLTLLGAAQAIPPAPVGVTDPYRLAEAAGALHGLPPQLMTALVHAESNGNPNALSRTGAMGLAQLMPGTARDLGVINPWNPWENVYGGAKYLSQQLRTFGRLDHALAAYNAGPGNVNTYRGIPPFAETQSYVKKISAEFIALSASRPVPPRTSAGMTALGVAPIPANLPAPYPPFQYPRAQKAPAGANNSAGVAPTVQPSPPPPPVAQVRPPVSAPRPADPVRVGGLTWGVQAVDTSVAVPASAARLTMITEPLGGGPALP